MELHLVILINMCEYASIILDGKLSVYVQWAIKHFADIIKQTKGGEMQHNITYKTVTLKIYFFFAIS